MIALHLPRGLRPDFKWPRGPVYRGRISRILSKMSPHTLSCIGDVVSRSCLESGLKPTVAAVDGSTRRRERVSLESIISLASRLGMDAVNIVNPPGFLTITALEAVCWALRTRNPTLLIVDGEEDLLALPAIACTPPGGVVVYGAPGMGAVVASVDMLRAREAQQRMLQMRPVIIDPSGSHIKS